MLCTVFAFETMSYAAPPSGAEGPWQPPRHEIDFSVIGESFSLLFAHWKVYIIPGIVIFLLSIPSIIVSLASTFFPDTQIGGLDMVVSFVLQIGLTVGASIVGSLMYAGIVKYTWNVIRGNGASSSDLWIGFQDPLGYLGLGIIIGLLSFVGFFACCVGLLVAGGATMFALPIKVTQGVTSTVAISESWAMVKKDWILAAVFYLVVVMLSQIGAFACYIGLMLTLSYMYIAPTVLYSRYIGMSGSVESSGPTNYPRGGAGFSQGIGEQSPPPKDEF